MAKYVFSYHGGSMATTQEEMDAAMAAWGGWFGQLGSAVLDPGNPIGRSLVVSTNGDAEAGSDARVSGYSLIEADSIEAASDLARGCPILERGGTVEVGETIAM